MIDKTIMLSQEEIIKNAKRYLAHSEIQRKHGHDMLGTKDFLDEYVKENNINIKEKSNE